MRVILASASPRRRDLLERIGLVPEIIIPEIQEGFHPGESVEQYLKRISREKLKAVYRPEFFESLMIAADTVVVMKNRIFGKPSDIHDACRMLTALSGRSHDVFTGVCLLFRDQPCFQFARTKVTFAAMSDSEIQLYLAHNEYQDKAGAYGIQGWASLFIEKIDGCFFNVVGFPLQIFYTMLKELGIIDQIMDTGKMRKTASVTLLKKK